MASVACEVDLRCRGDDAAARLVSLSGLRCLPGLRPGSDDPPALAEHEFELPYLGLRRQAIDLRAEQSTVDGRREVIIGGRGPLISYAARWALGSGPATTLGALRFEYEVSDDLMTEAMNELRSRNPLPFRSHADAILRLAVSEAFAVYFSRVLAEYADAARALLEADA
jgi:hypothetical protein